MFPESEKNYISTKFYEIIYAQTPFLYIGPSGRTSEFITQYQLGVHILPENIETELPNYLEGNISCNFNLFPINNYTYDSITRSFIEKITHI